MAQLPRLQEMGIIAGDQPRIQFAEQAEQARLYAGLNQNLNRLSNFAFGIAAEARAQENRMIGIQMRADLEGEVQQQLSNLRVEIETGQITDQAVVQERIKAMQGLVKPLADVDINQANGLMLSISSGGRALMAKSADTLVKLYEEQAKAQFEDMFPALQNNITTIYETTRDPAEIQRQKGDLRNKLYAMGATNAPTLVPQLMKEFDKRFEAARDEALVGYFTSGKMGRSSASVVKNLREGNAGEYTQVWNSLGVDERNKVIKNYISREAEMKTLADRANAGNAANAERNTLIALKGYLDGEIPVAEVEKMAITGQIKLTTAQFLSLKKGEMRGESEGVTATLQNLVLNGQIGEDQLDTMHKEQRISMKELVKLKEYLRKNVSGEMRDALGYVVNEFVPDPMSPGDRRFKQISASVQAQLRKEEAEALEKGLPFKPKERAIELVEDRKKGIEFQAYEKERGFLEQDLAAAGVSFRDDYTDADLRAMGVDDATVRARIVRRIKKIQVMRGN